MRASGSTTVTSKKYSCVWCCPATTSAPLSSSTPCTPAAPRYRQPAVAATLTLKLCKKRRDTARHRRDGRRGTLGFVSVAFAKYDSLVPLSTKNRRSQVWRPHGDEPRPFFSIQPLEMYGRVDIVGRCLPKRTDCTKTRSHQSEDGAMRWVALLCAAASLVACLAAPPIQVRVNY